MAPSAKIILDSISTEGHRLTTLEVVMHRFVLAEMNTHRMLSRNSASSRAIPVHKQIERVLNDPAIPLEWGSKQAGMQAGEPLDKEEAEVAEYCWLLGRDAAVEVAQNLDRLNVHKQVVNRVLEPYLWHAAIFTATEWDNFFALRCNPMAQPEIYAAAKAMQVAMEASDPVLLEQGDWHTPFIQPDEEIELGFRVRVSAARCARVSYLTHDGVRNIDKDLELYDRLTTADPMHASPLEHVATPAPPNTVPLGNFTGWKQLRHTVGIL